MTRVRIAAALAVGAVLAVCVSTALGATGDISTVAGSTGGFSGDNGPATAAQMRTVTAVAATADGGYLIADQGNSRVRRVSPSGVITTIAGNGTAAFGGDNGPATSAQLNAPPGPRGGARLPPQADRGRPRGEALPGAGAGVARPSAGRRPPNGPNRPG